MSYPASQRAPTQNERGLPIAVILGAALIVVGLGLVVFSVSMQGDSPLFLVGGVVVGGGVLQLTTALAREAHRRREYLAAPDDPRWHGGAGIVQLAGRTCAECGKKIVVGADGVSCDACGAPTHLDCGPRHRSIAHSDDMAVSGARQTPHTPLDSKRNP
jgi:hypothetical protein